MDYSSFLSVESSSRKPSPLKALNLKCVDLARVRRRAPQGEYDSINEMGRPG
jgi:hypothetical protein